MPDAQDFHHPVVEPGYGLPREQPHRRSRPSDEALPPHPQVLSLTNDLIGPPVHLPVNQFLLITYYRAPRHCRCLPLPNLRPLTTGAG